MADSASAVQCFIASFERPAEDSKLVEAGLCTGMVVFSVPELGILFRCRAQGTGVEMEFGAFFALLKFIREKLKHDRIVAVHVNSSHPEFVFAFTGQSGHLKPGTKRRKLLKRLTAGLKVTVSFVEPQRNQALLPAYAYPSLPEGKSLKFGPTSESSPTPVFKPFQRGIHL
jgi:hypothetical protein